MERESIVAAYVGGELKLLASDNDTREAVLALPLNRLLVKMVKVPPEQDVVEFAKPILKDLSPFPDDDITVGYETVRETAEGTIVIAAALPESKNEDIGAALDAAKLNVVKIDLLELGQLRGVLKAIGANEKARRAVLIGAADGISLIVIDADMPVMLRAIAKSGDIKREMMLSLLEAEDFWGAKALKEIVVIGEVPEAGLEAFAPVRKLEVGEDAALVGVQERMEEMGTLDALPDSWREVLMEARFKAKLIRNVAMAGAIWGLIMLVLFGVPITYGYMTDYQKGLCKRNQKQYQLVKDMKEKTELVQKYSDHTRGALEIMKAVSDRLPAGIELSSWNYKRDDPETRDGGISVSGDSVDASAIYAFKDAMDKMGIEESEEGEEVEEGMKVFEVVDLGNLNSSKTGQRFTLDCRFHGEEEQ